MTKERQYTDKIATTTTKTYQHYKDDNDHYNDTNDDNEKKPYDNIQQKIRQITKI